AANQGSGLTTAGPPANEASFVSRDGYGVVMVLMLLFYPRGVCAAPLMFRFKPSRKFGLLVTPFFPRRFFFLHVFQSMAGPIDKPVFQRRLAERDGADLPGKRFHQARDPLMPIGHFQPHVTFHNSSSATELI